MLRMAWIVATVVLFAGCTGQENPGETTSSTDSGGASEPTDGFDAANFTKVKEEVYQFEDLVAGAAPGSTFLEDHYETFPPAREDTFQVGENVWKMGFSSGMGCGTGSGRIVVHGPEGQRVYASYAWNAVGVPSAPCVVVEEQMEGQGSALVPGQYTVRYYVAGAMTLGLEVSATYLVPNEADAA